MKGKTNDACYKKSIGVNRLNMTGLIFVFSVQGGRAQKVIKKLVTSFIGNFKRYPIS